jgi:ABC-type glycerol-3-phosphate transport system permease component
MRSRIARQTGAKEEEQEDEDEEREDEERSKDQDTKDVNETVLSCLSLLIHEPLFLAFLFWLLPLFFLLQRPVKSESESMNEPQVKSLKRKKKTTPVNESCVLSRDTTAASCFSLQLLIQLFFPFSSRMREFSNVFIIMHNNQVCSHFKIVCNDNVLREEEEQEDEEEDDFSGR